MDPFISFVNIGVTSQQGISSTLVISPLRTSGVHVASPFLLDWDVLQNIWDWWLFAANPFFAGMACHVTCMWHNGRLTIQFSAAAEMIKGVWYIVTKWLNSFGNSILFRSAKIVGPNNDKTPVFVIWCKHPHPATNTSYWFRN
jgi:hypothetical protein